MPIVTLRYWAAAKDAAGLAEEKVEAATLAQALAWAASRAERLRPILARSSFLIDGEPAGRRPHQSIKLGDDMIVEVLPPFAGG